MSDQRVHPYGIFSIRARVISPTTYWDKLEGLCFRAYVLSGSKHIFLGVSAGRGRGSPATTAVIHPVAPLSFDARESIRLIGP